MARITLRIDLEGKGSIGPGKVRLLELIDEHGSIRRAGSVLKMSYARAWGLVRDLGATFGKPVVDASPGGKSGGGAKLTPLGRHVVDAYRAAERKAAKASRPQLAALRRLAT
ncbi:MAG: LysR family transcriptional regulator [Alphaproteobacteria bacterium]|nr:LysR family transcriptional regulator [Alphaproteobacteria bacterium]